MSENVWRNAGSARGEIGKVSGRLVVDRRLRVIQLPLSPLKVICPYIALPLYWTESSHGIDIGA